MNFYFFLAYLFSLTTLFIVGFMLFDSIKKSFCSIADHTPPRRPPDGGAY